MGPLISRCVGIATGLVIVASAFSACIRAEPYRATGSAITVDSALIAAINPTAPGFSDGLFGKRAVSTTNIGPLRRWRKVDERFAVQRRHPEKICAANQVTPCPPDVWKKLVVDLARLPMSERVVQVNDFFNHVPYVPAEVNWHDVAYWETPFEFLARGGQCQDYAIAKYLALRESGVPEQHLRFVVVHDKALALDHAITVVNVDGEALALDNQMTMVTPIAQLAQRYAPYYALNDLDWWPYLAPE